MASRDPRSNWPHRTDQRANPYLAPSRAPRSIRRRGGAASRDPRSNWPRRTDQRANPYLAPSRAPRSIRRRGGGRPAESRTQTGRRGRRSRRHLLIVDGSQRAESLCALRGDDGHRGSGSGARLRKQGASRARGAPCLEEAFANRRPLPLTPTQRPAAQVARGCLLREVRGAPQSAAVRSAPPRRQRSGAL